LSYQKHQTVNRQQNNPNYLWMFFFATLIALKDLSIPNTF
jgi:hypothetical protein